MEHLFRWIYPILIPESINRKEWQPHTLSPSYWYPKKFSGKKILLRMRSFSNNSVELAVEKEDKNGNFIDSELFKGTLSSDRTTMYGIWKLHNKNKQLKFSMKRVYPYHVISVSPNCLHTVSKSIVSLLEEAEVDQPENGTIENWKHIKFLPTPVGIQFDFDPYQLGGYLSAATIFVKKKDIEQCVKYLPSYH